MELPHAVYFYTLAQVGITFAGFATILMALRETRGRGMSKFHLWVAKSYIQSGLVTAMSADAGAAAVWAGLIADSHLASRQRGGGIAGAGHAVPGAAAMARPHRKSRGAAAMGASGVWAWPSMAPFCSMPPGGRRRRAADF